MEKLTDIVEELVVRHNKEIEKTQPSLCKNQHCKTGTCKAKRCTCNSIVELAYIYDFGPISPADQKRNQDAEIKEG